jgi:hypothetical protein
MKKRTVLYADSGKVLTNGTTYGKIIYLADPLSENSYREITDEEYAEILKEQEESQSI